MRNVTVARAVAWRTLHNVFTNVGLVVPQLAFPLFFFAAFAGGLSRIHEVPGFDEHGRPARRDIVHDAGHVALALRLDRQDVAVSTLGEERFLQKVRETGDPSFYPRAGSLVQSALRIAPHDSAALTVAGTLALARHEFRQGLSLGEAALSADPSTVRPLGVIVDAQIELGHYDAAGRTLQKMLDEKPSLASYARASYYRELHGDLRGAATAMSLAVDAGGQAPENVAYVQTLLGTLEFDRGRLAEARRAYTVALLRQPGFPAADAGLARVEAAQGQLPAAIRRYRRVVARLPLPEYVVGLGEAELAAGRPGAARRDLALVGAEERLLQANGVNTDVDLALYEASLRRGAERPLRRRPRLGLHPRGPPR